MPCCRTSRHARARSSSTSIQGWASFPSKPPRFTAQQRRPAAVLGRTSRAAEGSNVRVIDAIMPLVDTPMTAGRGSGKIPAAACATAIADGLGAARRNSTLGKARALRLLLHAAPATSPPPSATQLTEHADGRTMIDRLHPAAGDRGMAHTDATGAARTRRHTSRRRAGEISGARHAILRRRGVLGLLQRRGDDHARPSCTRTTTSSKPCATARCSRCRTFGSCRSSRRSKKVFAIEQSAGSLCRRRLLFFPTPRRERVDRIREREFEAGGSGEPTYIVPVAPPQPRSLREALVHPTSSGV